MSLKFLSADEAQVQGAFTPLLQSNIEAELVEAGAQIEERDGWRVAANYGDTIAEKKACADSVGVAELSSLGITELLANPAVIEAITTEVAGTAAKLGEAVFAGGAWWCTVKPDRVLAITSPGDTASLRGRLESAAAARNELTSVTDLTSTLTTFSVSGPLARDTFARITALDLREREFPLRGFLPGSIGRVPGLLLRQGPDSFLHTFGAASAQYMWESVIDAAEELGGRAVGIDALGPLGGAVEATTNA
jgi:heterotetrameric sarcosine oxidase gamma subunit